MRTMNRWPAVEGEYEGELELEGELEYEDELEGEYEGEYEGELELEGEYEDELELEGEYEDELEGEWFVNPVRRVYPDAALMEHLGRAASEAESEDEAEAFIGALVPLAARIIPRVAPAIMRAAPQLIRAASQVVGDLRRQPATRRLVRAVPTIVTRTAQSLAGQVQHGRPLTADAAVRAFARQTQRVLGSPAARRQALRRSAALDRHYHRVVCR